MEKFLALIPVPSMGATVHELTVIDIQVEVGDPVAKGQTCAEFESDKSAFDFEAPCDGVIKNILVRAGDIVEANSPFIEIETADATQKHLEIKREARQAPISQTWAGMRQTAPVGPIASPFPASVPRPALKPAGRATSIKWTPKALRIAREAGLDPSKLTAIDPTGPGGRVSGDDVQAYMNIHPQLLTEAAATGLAASDTSKQTVCVAGIGYAVPRRVRTNEEILEKFPDKSADEVVKTTGISSRYVASEGEDVTTYASRASEDALAKAGMDVSGIDGIILATIIPDQPVPSAASALAKHLGIPHALAFDLNAACSGWLYALEIGRTFILSGSARTLLVVTAELLSRITNYEDYSTAFLFGDGAGAAVLTDRPGGTRLHRMGLSGDANQYEAIQRLGGGAKKPIAHSGCDVSDFYLSMNGAAVFKYAVVAFADMIEQTLQRENLAVDDVSWVVPHQANERILRAVSKRVGIPYERFVVTIGKYGNTSAASVSMALGWAAEEGIFRKGDKIIFCSVGAGLTYAGGLLVW